MTTSRRIFVGALFGALLVAGHLPARAQIASHENLIGKWQHVSLVRVIDGNRLAPQPSNGTIVEFKADGTWSAVGANTRSAGTYRWLDADYMELTVVVSNLALELGQVSVRQIRVDMHRLNMVITQSRQEMERYMPPAMAGVRRPEEVTVTTIFSRVVPE